MFILDSFLYSPCIILKKSHPVCIIEQTFTLLMHILTGLTGGNNGLKLSLRFQKLPSMPYSMILIKLWSFRLWYFVSFYAKRRNEYQGNYEFEPPTLYLCWVLTYRELFDISEIKVKISKFKLESPLTSKTSNMAMPNTFKIASNQHISHNYWNEV